MSGIVGRILVAAAVGAAVWLVIVIVGPAIASAGVPILSDIAAALVARALPIAIVAFVYALVKPPVTLPLP